jgi:type II secretory pathway pseudopilin PulG
MRSGGDGARKLQLCRGSFRAHKWCLREHADRRAMLDAAQATTGVHFMTAPMLRRHLLQQAQSGFTILEHAVSLSIIALLLGSIMVPLQTQIENRKVDETKRMLDVAQEMLVGFAAANGFFPCPATASSNGQEPLGSDHTTGSCPVWHGFLPAAVLGFRPTDAQGFALDAWDRPENRIRYAVSASAVGGIPQALTRVNGMRSAPLASFGAAPFLHICQSGNGVTADGCGSAVTLASNATIVVWSVGANAANGGKSVHEAQNPNPNGGSADRIFVSRGPSNVSGYEFDDLLTWLPATALLSRLVAMGQLTPAAQNAASPAVAPN